MTSGWSVGWWRELLQHLPTHGKPEPVALMSQQALDIPVARASAKVQLDSVLWYDLLFFLPYTMSYNYHTMFLIYLPLSGMWCFVTTVCLCISESYAQYWCSKLTDPKGVFAPCHSVISPGRYKDVSHTQSYMTNNASYSDFPNILYILTELHVWQL